MLAAYGIHLCKRRMMSKLLTPELKLSYYWDLSVLSDVDGVVCPVHSKPLRITQLLLKQNRMGREAIGSRHSLHSEFVSNLDLEMVSCD